MGATQIVIVLLISLIVSVVITLLRRWRREKLQMQNEIYLLQETVRALRLMLDGEMGKNERDGMGSLNVGSLAPKKERIRVSKKEEAKDEETHE